MKTRNFTLQPFPGTGPRPNIDISGTISRQAHTLAIRYLLQGRLTELDIPPLSNPAARRIGLWEKTCFEFFLAVKDSPGYWEFNLSPSGDWNVYRFEIYRQGLNEEKAFSQLPFSIREQSDFLRLGLEFDLGLIIRTDQAIEAAVTAVIKTRNREETFWAMAHPAEGPDFHHRDGFIVQL